MRNVVKVFGFLTLALLLPACGNKKESQYSIPGLPSPTYDANEVSVGVQNNDAIPYNVAVREFTNGVLTSQVHVGWPVAGTTAAGPGQAQITWNFNQDSAVYTHDVALFSTSGPLLDAKPFVKGSGPIYVAATITSASLNLQTTP